MEDFYCFFIVLGIGLVISGPAALAISIIALNKINDLSRRFNAIKFERFAVEKTGETPPQQTQPQPAATVPTTQPAPTTPISQTRPVLPKPVFDRPAPSFGEPVKPFKTITENFEQRIGTRWVLIAGVITVFVGVAFFLKYAYENFSFSPLGRITIVASSGLAALIIGEVTRRRAYDIVAKGVTALGFAMLYAAVFSAYGQYRLINSTTAFILAIVVTLGAMLYALGLNEILIALLALIGGFLTPVLVSTGENLPMHLFTYILVLSLGATLCAWYRQWRIVNILAFVGTFTLYTGWFEKFYRPECSCFEPIGIALGWLSVFFTIYMLVPILNNLVRKIKAQKEDVLLLIANATVTFYYIWTILYSNYRIQLAICAVVLSAVHLLMMGIVNWRCKEDSDLRTVFLVIGMFFLSIALPLYFKMNALAIAWAGQAVILAIVGLRYRSTIVQLTAAIVIALSIGQLLLLLPLHTEPFRLILNPDFGTWMFVAASLVIIHILYRRTPEDKIMPYRLISDVIYCATIVFAMLAFTMEWYWHCRYNIIGIEFSDPYFFRGLVVIFIISLLLYIVRPIAPSGYLLKYFASVTAIAGSIFAALGLTESYHYSFNIFANYNFIFSILFVAGLFAVAYILYRRKDSDIKLYYFFALAAVFVLWLLISEQIYLYWYYQNKFAGPILNWKLLSNMYISLSWAIYGAVLLATGFAKKIAALRYIALGLFTILLAKIFIYDMQAVKSLYRITAFLATGLTLVAVSYLYQFLKKKGFFDNVLNEK